MDRKGINCNDAQLACLWFLTKTSQKQDIKWFEKSSPKYTSRYRKKTNRITLKRTEKHTNLLVYWTIKILFVNDPGFLRMHAAK